MENKKNFVDLSEEEIELKNKEITTKTLQNIQETEENLKFLTLEKEKYLKLVENHFNNLQGRLENQYKLLNSNMDVLQTKEAKNLEEILQIAKQIEWIHEQPQKPVKLKVSNENFEETLKKSIRLIDNEKVPVEVYTQIDFLRHCDWKKVKEICEKYEDYNDLLILSWKAEAMMNTEEEGCQTLLKKILTMTPESDYDMVGIGKCYSLQDDEDSAFVWYEKSAQNGNTFGLLNLAYCFDHGLGCKKSKKKAYKMYKLCSEKGHVRGTYNLAVCFERGDGVDQDLNKAFELNEKSSKEGFPLSMYQLAVFYEEGCGCACDLKKAMYWYKKAYDTGYLDAKLEIDRLSDEVSSGTDERSESESESPSSFSSESDSED